jgi:hypothetical protein
MKIEEIQHGGDHYKDQPKHLQPIWLGIALNLNPMEYSVLKYLLRHRKKSGLEDLKKMVHFAQMLMEHEYGVCPVVVYPEQDSPSDVSGEETKLEDCADKEPVRYTEDKLPQVGDRYKRRDTGNVYKVLKVTDIGVVHMGKVENEQISHDTDWKLYFDQYERVVDPCPFQVDDIVQAQKLFENHHCPKWHIYRIEDDKALVSCVEDQQPGEIRRGEWVNYSVVGQRPPYRLPVVGELYKGAKTGDVYRVTNVSEADWVYLQHVVSGVIHQVQWRLDSSNYKLKESPSTVRYPVVGEVYRGKKSGNMYRVFEVKEEYVWFEDCKSGTIHMVNWKSGLSSDYERATNEAK